HFIDFLSTYNFQICPSTSVLGHACDDQLCTSGPTTFSIPMDTSLPVGIQDPGHFTVFNGAITNVSGYTTNTIAGTHHKYLTISGTSAGNGQNVLILFAGHLAAEQDWGTGNGAASFSG